MLAEPLLASPPQQLQRSTLARRAAIFLVPLLALAWWMSLHSPPHHQSPQHSSLDSEPPFWFGVSLGGWLLIEINPLKKIKSKPDIRPQWMFDELEATSELDFVSRLRETSDDFAIRTMQNHWRHYLTDSMLTHAAGVGVNAVRIPVGYWIMDSPTNGSSPLQYGISPEGFVTGGLNHLRDMLRTLAKRNIVAIIDMHALPCNSACVSDGLDCANPLAFMPDALIGDIERCTGACTGTTCEGPVCSGARTCDGKVFATSRGRHPGRTWRDVGLESLKDLADWVASLPKAERVVVAGLQLANEPALNSAGYDAAVKAYYTAALTAARGPLPSLPLLMSFIPPNDAGVPEFIGRLQGAGLGPLLIDHHWYLNWATLPGVELPWSELHRRACHEAAQSWSVYAAKGVHLVLGEWSLATNHDKPLDFHDAATVQELRQLFREQLSVYRGAPSVRGAFYWSLRMGSGWDPRPTAQAPDGAQREGSSAWRSRDGYPFKVWSLLEMADAGIVPERIDDAKVVEGACDGV